MILMGPKIEYQICAFQILSKVFQLRFPQKNKDFWWGPQKLARDNVGVANLEVFNLANRVS